jgi:hypothetical protein
MADDEAAHHQAVQDTLAHRAKFTAHLPPPDSPPWQPPMMGARNSTLLNSAQPELAKADAASPAPPSPATQTDLGNTEPPAPTPTEVPPMSWATHFDQPLPRRALPPIDQPTFVPPPPEPPPWVPNSQTWDVAAQIPASQRGLSAAILSDETGPTVVRSDPALTLRVQGDPPAPPTYPVVSDRGGRWEGTAAANFQARAEISVAAAPIPIAPTLYPPVAPKETVIVQNFVTINIRSKEFVEFDEKLAEVVEALRGSNEISAEVRNQLIAEITAGREILVAPKANRGLIDLLLANPLKAIIVTAGTVAGTAIVTHLAVQAVELLERLVGGT